MIRFFLFSLLAQCLYANPFAIDFKERKNLTPEDYVEIQSQMREIDILPLLKELRPTSGKYTTLEDFYSRCSRTLRQCLIDIDQNLLPSMKLVKINEGGPNCIVTCVPQNEIYVSLADSIPKYLEECGFNGHFLYLTGGSPNPTGREIQYVGVPYSFKIFMMLEAYNLGFEQILWIDSSMMPLNDPTPLFNTIRGRGALIMGVPNTLEEDRYQFSRYIFPTTRQQLLELTGVDVLNSFYVITRIFGLDMSSHQVWKMIEQYTKCVELGTPFLSCFPEEFVFTGILGQPEYREWPRFYTNHLMLHITERAEFEQMKATGRFFYQRRH